MNLNIKSIFKPIFTFLFFVLFSQIILPFFKKDNFPPFFIWSLFSKNPTHWTFYDLEIIDGAGETKYYTDMHIGDAELWQTLQN
ncbi:hypothetical protein K2X05_02575, partial [bacterium]|nr:hypothetical protein [bacterium]